MTDEPAGDGSASRADDRRRFLARLGVASAIAVPTVSSFSMDGLVIRQVTASAAGTVAPGPNLIQDPGFDI